MLTRRGDLGTAELRRAVDAAVADEHEIMVGLRTARVREVHVGEAGAAFEAEDRGSRLGRASEDPYHRERDQARGALCWFSVRRGCRSRRGSCRSRSRTGMGGASADRRCAGRHRDRVAAGAEMEIGEAKGSDGDEREGDDPRWAERPGSRASSHVLSSGRCLDARRAGGATASSESPVRTGTSRRCRVLLW